MLANEIICNEQIIASEVRVIAEDGSVTCLPLRQALKRAETMDTDLVQMVASDIPICRFMDVDRYRFEKAKADREQAKRQRELAIDVKEIQLRPVTNVNDLGIKARKARSFLEDGDKVKLVMRFRGRERSHKENGREIIETFLSVLGEHKIEKPLCDSDGDMTMILSPSISKADLRKAKKPKAVALTNKTDEANEG